MSPLAHHFVTMAYNNGWSNYRLYQACRKLTDAEFTALRVSFFPSIKATLNHNLTVDWYYIDALERGLRGEAVNLDARSFFQPEQPFDHCDDLWREQRAVDNRLIAACKALGPDLQAHIPVARGNGVFSETITRLLAHLFQHQIHHRGQAHAMLAGTRVPPPQLDEFFCEGDQNGDYALRQPDLRELGWTEEEIWGQPDGRRLATQSPGVNTT